MDLALVASILALLVGPLVYAATRTRAAAAALDAFALVGVAGLVCAHILPQSFALAGWIVVPAALAGLFGPGLACGTKLLAGRSSGRVTMPLALFAIALHALLDGAALAPGGHAADDLLPFAVVLHRVPVGLGIWWLARPMYGQRAALALMGSIAAFSLLGYFFGEALIAHAPRSGLALAQAVVAGSLMHVILKHPPHGMPHAQHGSDSATMRRLASGLGGLAGLALVVALERWHIEPPEASGVTSSATFVELALQSAPALLFAYVAVAAMHAWGFDVRSFLGRGGAWSQTVRGTFAGLPVPICSCGVIPIYRSLVHRRVPTPAAMSFLVATPEIGIAALFLSWRLLGGEITLLRVASAIVLALVVGLAVGRRAPVVESLPPEPEVGNQRARPARERLLEGVRYGFGDMVDGTAPWILTGLALAAVAAPLFDTGSFASLPPGIEVVVFALIGMPLYVCASGSTPLVAVLLTKGVSPGAAIAFLLTGPATNLTTFGVLGRLHGKRTALAFAAVAVSLTIVLGVAVDLLLPGAAASLPVDELDHVPTTLEVLCLVVLGAVFAVSFVRQGTRGFVGQVISPHGALGHDHAHDEGDDQAHGSCCHPADSVPRQAS